MSDYGGSDEGTVEYLGDRALDDYLGGEYDDGRSERGWTDSRSDDGGADEEVGSGVVVEDAALVRESLADLSFYFQTSFRGQAYGACTRGRVPVSGTVKGEMRNEKLFHCPDTLYMASALDESLVSKLKAGRVVSNVVVKTGGGKSTVLPAHIALSCAMRVLFIVPDALLKELNAKRLAKLLAPTRMWSDVKVATLVLLTPLEFLGRFMGSGWNDLDRFFDCVAVDESHLPLASMYALRAALVTKDIGQVSLLFLTATTGQADVQTVVEPEYIDVDVEDVVKDPGFVDGPYAVDRSLILVESDDRVRAVSALLSGHGLDVYTLESSATVAVVDSVDAAMDASTASMRFVVAHEKFGYAYNLHVVRVLTTATASVLVCKDGEWFYGPSLLSDVEIGQQMGRAGRGMVDSSRRGVVFAPKGVIPKYRALRPSEVFTAYVYLVAMNIRPRASIVEVTKEELPFGITPRVAAGLLTMACFPPRVAVRFLDGESRFPRRFVSGARHFSTVGGLSPIGDLAQPMRYSQWPEVILDEVLGVGGEVKVKIPVRAKGALAVHLALVCAAAEGCFKPRTTYVLEMSGYESGPDVGKRPGKYKKSALQLPALYTVERVVEPEVVEIGNGYSLDVPLSSQPTYGKRMGRAVPAIVTSHLASGGYAVGIPQVSYVSMKGKEFARLEFSNSPVDARSPGGTVAFQIDKEVWNTMVAGEPLTLAMFRMLGKRIGGDVVRFANCDAFSVWGNPWLSVLRTFRSDEILHEVLTKNASSWLVSFLATLWKRYVDGMTKAVLESHQVAGMWKDLVKRFKRSLKGAYGLGGVSSSLPAVAQSQEFYERIYAIREEFSCVITAMEEKRIFDIGRVTEIQRILPISRKLGSSLHDGMSNGSVRPLDREERDRLKDRFRYR